MNGMTIARAKSHLVLGAAVALALGAGAAFAAEPIHQGVDIWMTVAGSAHTSFAQEPIPAGFFCDGSAPFTGTVTFKGAPIATEPPGALGAIDTVVRRLDDAAFDDKGVAETRIELMALSLVSTAPIETSCGRYNVAVTLAGKQPRTTMRIFRTAALGGTYTAPLSLNVRATFMPVSGDPTGRREIDRRIDLGPGTKSVWAYVKAPQYKAGIRIDTRGSGIADAALPPSSNFLAGVEPAVLHGEPSRPVKVQSGGITCPSGQCPYQTCHCANGSTDPFQSSDGCDHLHCIWVCVQNGASGNGIVVTCAQSF